MAAPRSAPVAGFGRTGSKPKWKSAATVRRWSGCTGRGASIPIARSSRAWPPRNTIYAPRFPGTTRGDPDAVHALVSWLDLTVYHGELLDQARSRSARTRGPFIRRVYSPPKLLRLLPSRLAISS